MIGWYCVAKFAVHVLLVTGVTVRDAAPPSDQPVNPYCVPALPGCEAAAIMWLVPVFHRTLQGVVHVTPSAVIVSPDGELRIVCVTRGAEVTA
jgi:hypothetical protein